MYCPKCGTPSAPGQQYCGHCGSYLSTQQALNPSSPPRAKSSSGCLKFFLIGCVVLVAGIVAAVSFGGYLLDRWLGETIASENSSYGKRAESLRRAHPFTPASDGTITEDQLMRFLEISKHCATKLNSEEMRRAQEEMKNSQNPYLDGYRFFKKFGNAWRNALLEGLEKQQMSLVEYQHVHKNALRSWAALAKTEAEKLYDQQQAQKTPEGEQLPEIPEDVRKLIDQVTDVPPQNVELIKKHSKEVQEFLPAAPLAKMLFPLLVDPDENSVF